MLGQCGSLLWTWLVMLLIPVCVTEEEVYHQPKIKDIKALSDKLLENYSKYILPKESYGAFNVTVEVSLRAVGEIDEIEEKLSTVMWFYFSWIDESIRWDKNETGIWYITLGWNTVWAPVLRVSNPHADVSKSQITDRLYDTVIYDCEGTAYFDEMMTTRTTCDLDMTYYPFDTQSCDIEMQIVGSSKYWFNLDVEVHKYFSVEETYHGSWTLLNKSITSDGGTFKIKLKFGRRPLFLLLNILLPIIVLALLTPVVFVLPKKSGERVGYSITMLLAISVYMTIVSDHLPQNSQPMPLVSIKIFIWYILDASIVFVVIINTKINTMRATKPLSYLSRKFVILTRKITSILTCERNKRKKGEIGKGEASNQQSEETDKCIEMETDKGKENRDDQPLNSKDQNEEVTWQDLSHSIDKWCFVISYLFKISLPVIFLSVTKGHSHE